MTKLLKIFAVLLLLTGCFEKDEKKAQDYNLVIQTDSGEVKYNVENASSMEELEKGLMFRDSLPKDGGMIFDLTHIDGPIAMWMKDTKISLDMVFLDKNGMVVDVFENAVPYSEEHIVPYGPVSYVIELNAGEIAKNHIVPGALVKHKFFDEQVQDQPASEDDANDDITNVDDDGTSEETVVK